MKLDKNKDSLLHLLSFRAGNSSCPKLIQDLISNDLLPSNIHGPDRERPLSIAVRGGNLELYQFLVHHGAYIEEVVGINQHGQIELKAYSDGGQKIITGLGQLYLEKNAPKLSR